MKVISYYEMREHGPTHAVGKTLEDVALVNVKQGKREQWLENMSFRIDQALSRFGNSIAGKNQRDIIVKRYLEDEDVCDYMVYSEIDMNERTYR